MTEISAFLLDFWSFSKYFQDIEADFDYFLIFFTNNYDCIVTGFDFNFCDSIAIRNKTCNYTIVVICEKDWKNNRSLLQYPGSILKMTKSLAKMRKFQSCKSSLLLNPSLNLPCHYDRNCEITANNYNCIYLLVL